MARSPNMSGSRRLLARVRDTMAGAGTAQERLDRIATTIAADLVAEVCSIYVLRAGEVLELFANTGLTPEAVHLTRLNIGEGLIGVIAQRARPLALTNLQDHPAYAYRPETGEERYHSLAGVPILRDGRVTGVLAIQNRTQRQYTEEELETLETIAMVVAELIAGGELITSDELQAIEGLTMLPVSIEGVRLNGGLAIGTALRHERRISIDKLVAEDTDEEKRRFVGALGEMHGAIDKMLAASDMASGGEHREILETYRMFAEDAGWLARIHEAIETGLTAEAAVIKVRNDTRVRFRQQTDPYLRERLHDFEDLANRLLMHLAGDPDPAPKSAGPADIILFARNMGPAELLDYDRSHLKGLVLEEGSATTHVAIVAKALDIPVIGRAGDVMGVVENNDRVVLDGDNAEVHIRPSEEALQSFADTLNQRQQRIAAYSSLLDVPAETKDGLRMSLNINAGLFVDVQNMLDTGADGIGLYRTEIPFMESSDFPDVDRQAELYKRIIDQSAGKPVIFRTLDVGGDKGLPYWKMDEGENPAMGWRAVRVALDRPVLLRHQFRALIRAADGRDLKIMFPMITEVAEFDALRDILMREMRTAEKRGRKLPGALQVGTMLEVPALAFQMKSLLQRVDFVSVGSNDLFQFLFASDRGNPLLADRYDPLSPPALTLLGDLVRQCDDAGIPISLCGEIAGRPLDAMALVGLGFRNLSMAPSSIGPVKAMVRSLSVSDLKRYLDTLLQSHEHSLREKLREFAVDHGVII
ncbi:MAG: phosphoenolpyruvate--protein phosphotransferase [Rhodospirillaceae bacterium]|jgi:phosphotransferase system enzyme I (PtsP)|nr:phosphoenolpyruvate--protein phosphotransferase [Rhodospirillaceae bacterium]MBT4117781.1 phosphoenolpyruvate--protein phosphotransferase [Rhodospirillaceae bacterium]MBT4672445.1 phosphoenolpyruvate--protein phosphotransferase [Rhodospirillaceae bacterium]MBT4718369.1 phosphoenolpyruvate--protein phosphotransferase [Rhodospirillaceae bacterium]MBT4748173.1 phosphoenolpyruvate--protein phosphotransferase [Rhodospirillaceae bacterium]